MTYLVFHLTFIVPAILLLLLIQKRPLAGLGTRETLKWLGAVLLLAFVYTTPWDNYLVARGVWTYPPGRVIGTIGYVPIEEYAFFLLQPVLTGLLYFALLGRGLFPSEQKPHPSWFRGALTSVFLGLASTGVLALFAGGHWLYYGLIAAWAAPVIAGLSWIGADKVWNDRYRVSIAVIVPTLYLWVADRVAIAEGIWDITDATRTGVELVGLPVEEALFFVVTNVLCVFGLALFLPAPVPTRGS